MLTVGQLGKKGDVSNGDRKMVGSDPEEVALDKLEAALIHLHERSSVLSDLADVPELTAHNATMVRKLMNDAGEVSRQSMVLLEGIVAAFRILREPQHHRRPSRQPMSRPKFIVRVILVGIAGCLLGVLIGALYAFSGLCAVGGVRHADSGAASAAPSPVTLPRAA